MNDLDLRLRNASARLRESAPSAEATETALRTLGDVELDDQPSRRTRLWIVTPAIVAAAAAIVGVLVLTRPDEQAVVPADTTLVDVTTTTTIAEGDLGFGVSLQMSNENFDGDGGACLTLSTATDSASGCAAGATMRAAFGQPLLVRLDGTPYTFFPAGVDGSGPPLLTDSAIPSCFTAADLPGALVENAGCTSDGLMIVGTLPATPDGTVTWTAIGPASDALDLVVAAPDLRTRVFRSETCVIVAAGDIREACGTPGAFVRLAGSADAPIIVTSDSGAGVATVEPLDPATPLRLNECPDLTAGELVGLLPAHGMAGSLLCRGDTAAVWSPLVLVEPRDVEESWDILDRADDGTWSVAASGVNYTCTDGIAAAACATLEVFDLAQLPWFPTVESLTGFDEALGDGSPLPGRPAIEELPALEPAPDLPSLAEAVRSALHIEQGLDGSVDVLSDSLPIVIRRTNLDDSVTDTIYVLAVAELDDGTVAVASNGTRAVDVCGRGTTTLDGATVCI